MMAATVGMAIGQNSDVRAEAAESWLWKATDQATDCSTSSQACEEILNYAASTKTI
jgi:hypothetical protein